MFTVQTLTSVINQLLPEPHAGLLAGLLFGTKTSLSRELYDALVRSGTLHIVALSGMNISILSRLITHTLLPMIGRRIASLLTILLIVWFVWFVGPSASIVRAAIMGSISLLAILLGRQYWAMLAWVLAVGIMLLLNFDWLFDLSFQLSALATLGIILFGGRAGGAGSTLDAVRSSLFDSHRQGPDPLGLNQGFFAKAVTVLEKTRRAASECLVGRSATPALVVRWFWNLFKDDLRLTLAAQVFTIPLILFHFHRISLISPVSNVLIGWLIGPLTGLGWVTAIAGWMWLPLGQVVAWVDWVLLQYLLAVVRITSTLPFSSLGN